MLTGIIRLCISISKCLTIVNGFRRNVVPGMEAGMERVEKFIKEWSFLLMWGICGIVFLFF